MNFAHIKAAWLVVAACLVSILQAQEIQVRRAKADPYGYPRPAPGETCVPVRTSFYFELGFSGDKNTDDLQADSLMVSIGPHGRQLTQVILPGQHFAKGYSGKIIPTKSPATGLTIYIDSDTPLAPSTRYVVAVSVRSKSGAELGTEAGSWQFTTEDNVEKHALLFSLDLSSKPVCWHGGFFTGFCKPSFCTSPLNGIPTYELMDAIRKRAPRAWSLQRDFSATAMEHQPSFLSGSQPNVVRERETRRIVGIEKQNDINLLRVEDFFGHEQYGIGSHRLLADDYHPGDEVLIADGVNHAQARVVEIADDSHHSKSLRVTSFDEPQGGWRIAYSRPVPIQEDPLAPGIFPPGGCYLRKLRPAGTPHYYWGRIDREWDLARRFGRRLVVNFTDAPGDLAVDGMNWTFPKDYAQYHQVVRAYTDHVIGRYGDASREFVWSVFNEPDLASAFWRSANWDELQKFYDYTVDAVLRSWEDHGYDSERVRIGGLEIGAIFGVHIERPILQIFLCHCSPRATCPGALAYNAAVADKRLDGKRSRRVENLCRTTGKGSPCDFISVHSYNASETMAAKLIRAKELALETDAEYYANLWVNSFESCPNWSPPPDVAAADSYLGNGYFATWCADVARRQLTKTAEDTRYGFGETILTFWPWPNSNFGGHNNATRVISIDDDGDGKTDRHETIAMPILNFLGLMAEMGDDYWVLREHAVEGHVVSGFASKNSDAIRVLLYAHQPRDTQSRSQDTFEISLDLRITGWEKVSIQEYRFDKDHNSYYHVGRRLRDRPIKGTKLRSPSGAESQQLIADLTSGDRAKQLAALNKASSLTEIPETLFAIAIDLYQETKDEEIRAAIEQAGQRLQMPEPCYGPEELATVRELSQLKITKESSHSLGPGGTLCLQLDTAANGANLVVIKPSNP